MVDIEMNGHMLKGGDGSFKETFLFILIFLLVKERYFGI